MVIFFSFANHLFAIIFHTVPSVPLNSDVLSIAGSPTELLVTWDPPSEPNGIILSYTVYYYDLPMEEYQLLSNVTITSQPEHKEIPGNKTEIVLVNLTTITGSHARRLMLSKLCPHNVHSYICQHDSVLKNTSSVF